MQAITNYEHKLDINEFLIEMKYDIDKIYIDKFWDSIQDEKWLYIDDNMLEWMGFNRSEIKKINKITLIYLKIILILTRMVMTLN